MLEAKIGAISANGYGAAEHGCSLFMPAPISPVTLGNQMGKWAEPYDAAFLARWGARYAPSIIIEGEGHRWLSSAFVHGSWSQMIICLLNLAVIGAMVERRYGTPRFAALFILSTRTRCASRCIAVYATPGRSAASTAFTASHTAR